MRTDKKLLYNVREKEGDIFYAKHKHYVYVGMQYRCKQNKKITYNGHRNKIGLLLSVAQTLLGIL